MDSPKNGDNDNILANQLSFLTAEQLQPGHRNLPVMGAISDNSYHYGRTRVHLQPCPLSTTLDILLVRVALPQFNSTLAS